jgi:hypothetical protein
MTPSSDARPELYEFRLAERLTPALRHAFADCAIREEHPISYVVASIDSPAALDRIMERFERLGLRVIELQRLGA